MKTLTCAQMSGPCEHAMTAGTEAEMMEMGWKHVEEMHPEISASMATMPQEEKDKWASDFHNTWEATPEDAEAPAEMEAEASPEMPA